MGWLYLIKEENVCDGNRYKIGVTSEKDANKRLKKLQTGNPNKLSFLGVFETKYPYKLESIMHGQYSDKNILGEWYELDDEDIIKFVPLCERFNKIIESLNDNPFFNNKAKII